MFVILERDVYRRFSSCLLHSCCDRVSIIASIGRSLSGRTVQWRASEPHQYNHYLTRRPSESTMSRKKRSCIKTQSGSNGAVNRQDTPSQSEAPLAEKLEQGKTCLTNGGEEITSLRKYRCSTQHSTGSQVNPSLCSFVLHLLKIRCA